MGWIAVDFDGTLAHHGGTIKEPGLPIPRMLERVKTWLAAGKDVRIFTARVGCTGVMSFGTQTSFLDDEKFCEEQRTIIDAWCLRYLGRTLPITATKDFATESIWDDPAVRVECNTGRIISYSE